MKKTALVVTGLACVLATAIAVLCCREAEHAPQTVPQIGTIDVHDIPEGSGIIASRRHQGIYWTHGDSGNEAAVFAVTREGRLVGKFPVDAKNNDWEDIAADGEGHLYIAATGNNSGKRKTVEVLRLDEPDPREPRRRLRPDRVWRLSFPQGPLNCEGLFVHEGQGYLISKLEDGQAAALYQFSLAESARPVMLQRKAVLPINSAITAADITPDGNRIAILSFNDLFIFEVAGDVARLVSVTPMRIPLVSPHDLEACCFAPDGLVVTAESGEVYLFPDRRSVATP